MQRRGLFIERQKNFSFEFDNIIFNEGLRIDLFVENKVVVELKSVERIAPVHYKQVQTYLRLLHLPVGLLINFGAGLFKDGVKRIANDYKPPENSPLRINQRKQ